MSSSKDDKPPQQAPLTMEEMLRQEPTAVRLFDRVEIFLAVVGVLTSLVATLLGDQSVSLGWVEGWVVGQVNVALLRWLVERILISGATSKMSAVALTLKMSGLLVGSWLLLSLTQANVMAFAGAYGGTLAGLVVGGVICAPRRKAEADLEGKVASGEKADVAGS